MNENTIIRTPYHTMPITMAMMSVDRKVYRDIFCIECGQPFMAITDKFISIIDAAVPINMLRTGERLLEGRCGRHTCKQRYNVYF